MTTTVAAVHGKMGEYEYYQCTMKTKDLISRTSSAVDYFTDETWQEMQDSGSSVQREPNMKRILEEISPYLIRSKKRFFNSIAVALDTDQCEFNSLDQFPVTMDGKSAHLSSVLLPAYKDKASNIGFLTIDDTDPKGMLILDGQHRMLALKQVATEQDKLRQVMKKKFEEDFDSYSNHDVLNDDISVVFLKVPNIKEMRKIFEDLNTYAQKQSKDVEILNSESNPWYKITQSFCFGNPIRADFLKNFVQRKGTSLSERVRYITTTTHLVQMITFLTDKGGFKFKKQMQLDSDVNKSELDQAKTLCFKELTDFYSNVGVFKKILKDSADPIEQKKPDNKDSLLLKPLPQVALFKAIYFLKENTDMDIDTIYRTVNKIDWSFGNVNSQWRDVVISASLNILTGARVEELLSRMIVFYVAGSSKCLSMAGGQDWLDKLLADFRDQVGDQAKELPEVQLK